MAAQEQPDWLDLPSDLLRLIGLRSRDAVTGLAAFRSVCRAWRAAVGPAPRLLLPRSGSPDSESPSEHALVFPLSRGWSVVVDARDASCHLSHLATGATAALPNLNAVWDGGHIRTLRYVHRPDAEKALRSRDFFYRTYLEFTDLLRLAVHNATPPDAPATAAAAGMTIMVYHVMQERTAGMLFCRPGDAAWTKVAKPHPIGYGFFDFAYHDGRMYGMDALTDGRMAVYDAATLDALHLVQLPPATAKLAIKMYGLRNGLEEFDYVHLVALPDKLVLVRTRVKSNRPVAFDIFELGSTPDADGLAWLKVKDAGNYELFLDRYHATFRENDTNNGTRIYYVHDEHNMHNTPKVSSTAAAYCYNMQDNKLECVYRTPEDSHECSTRPSWFVP